MKKKFTGRREFIRVYRVNGWVRAVIIRDHPNARCYTVLSDDGNDAYGRFSLALARVREICGKE